MRMVLPALLQPGKVLQFEMMTSAPKVKQSPDLIELIMSLECTTGVLPSLEKARSVFRHDANDYDLTPLSDPSSVLERSSKGLLHCTAAHLVTRQELVHNITITLRSRRHHPI